VGVDTLVIHRDGYEADTLGKLLAAFDTSPLLRRRAEVGSATVYTLLPLAGPGPLGAEAGAGRSIYVSGDERLPGLPALALTRRWRERGYTLYGPGRTRYYAALAPAPPGAVFDFGLLAADENPTPHGFTPGDLRWRDHGLALYASDPALLANLNLARPLPGMFHPTYPSGLEIAAQPRSLSLGNVEMAWNTPADALYLELDLVSLGPQPLMIGGGAHPLAPGASTIVVPLSLGRATSVAGQEGTLAIRRARVYSAPPSEVPAAGAGISAAPRFEGSMLQVDARAAGAGTLLLDVWGAAAYDDRPLHLLAGTQSIPAAGGALSFAVDLLHPQAPWLSHSEPAQDGRYIVYLKDADQPHAPGIPVAKFTIRAGALVDAEPLPLPLTGL
jgi:hypothetical protein